MNAPAKLFAFVLAGLLAPAFAEGDAKPPQQAKWSFDGVFGTYDRGALQRGFQVYREVCSSCHGLTLVSFHDLTAPGGPGFSEAEAKAIAGNYTLLAEPDAKGDIVDENGIRLTRPGILSDRIPSPYANENAARTTNNGALPPDLSLIVKARRGEANYVYSILTGFAENPPHGFKTQEGMYFNPYFTGRNIAMPQPLREGAVTFSDGTPNTLAQEAHDVTTFLAWASDPKLEERHRLGFEVLAFLILFAGLLFLSTRKVWKGVGE